MTMIFMVSTRMTSACGPRTAPLVDVPVSQVRHRSDDVVHAFRCERCLHALHEQDHELHQRGLVHDIHPRHLNDGEVDDGSAGGHGPELLALLADVLLSLVRGCELGCDLGGLLLGRAQDLNKLLVLEQTPRVRGKFVEQGRVERKERLGSSFSTSSNCSSRAFCSFPMT